MTIQVDAFDALVVSIYHAAEDPSTWPHCLEGIRVAVNGSGATLLYNDTKACRRSLAAQVGFDESDIALYRDYYNRIDPWGLALRSRCITPGRAIDGRELVAEPAVRESEYFVDFGRRIGSAHSAFGVLEQDASKAALIVVARAHGQAPFEAEAVERLTRLLPHLQQACRLHRRLTSASVERSMLCSALDHLATGVVLVDRRGTPLFVNREARRIAQDADGFTIGRTCVQGSTPLATQRIAAAVASVTGLSGPRVAEQAAFPIQRRSGRRPYRVVIVPSGTMHGGLGAEVNANAAIFVSDDEWPATNQRARLEALFGLTAAESAVAAKFVSGHALREIAEALGVKTSTIRWHMKQILQKCGVGTQAQLVTLLMRASAIK